MLVQSKRTIAPYLYIAPAIILLIILLLYPMVTVLRYSLYNNAIVTHHPTFVGLQHYIQLFKEGRFRTSILNTAAFTIGSVILHVCFGLLLAVLLNEPINPRARSIFRVLLIMPWVFTAVIVALLWRLILNPLGVFNFVLKALGIIGTNITWFGDPGRAMPTLVAVNLWAGFPFVMVSLLAGLQGIPEVLYEAAIVDGAGRFRQFIHITIPMLKPVLISISLLDFIWTFRLFPLIWLTTGGGPLRATETLSIYSYLASFNNYEFSKGASIAMIILLATMALSVFYIRSRYPRRAKVRKRP